MIPPSWQTLPSSDANLRNGLAAMLCGKQQPSAVLSNARAFLSAPAMSPGCVRLGGAVRCGPLPGAAPGGRVPATIAVACVRPCFPCRLECWPTRASGAAPRWGSPTEHTRSYPFAWEAIGYMAPSLLPHGLARSPMPRGGALASLAHTAGNLPRPRRGSPAGKPPRSRSGSPSNATRALVSARSRRVSQAGAGTTGDPARPRRGRRRAGSSA